MKNGYADFRITNTDVAYQANPPGYVITITMEEGPQYHVSGVSVDSHIPQVSGPALLQFSALKPGDVYDAGGVDKTVDAMTRDVARQGYAFSEVRPHGERDTVNHTIALQYSVDNGPKVYVERIDIVGNTRTRDYVIRREFDIGEGDPYNHVLIERAERRLNGLGYFKKVHISNRPGSSPDRVIVVVDVEDQPTGSISLSGGYSTQEGIMAELAYTETNFLGRGQYVRLSVSDGQYSRGWKASFTEPYFLGQRLAAGFDVYHQNNLKNQYALYENWTTGATLRLGIPVTDDLTFQPNYSLYESRISIPNTSSQPYDDCSGPNQPWIIGGTFFAVTPTPFINCLTNGEAPVEIKQAAAQGTVVTSMAGFSLIYSTLDNRKDPTSGWFATYKQDVAGLGGHSDFVRETLDARWYHPITEDFIGQIHLQGGQINGFGSRQLDIINNFMLGPTLVRGFAPGGIGPRDISSSNNLQGAAIGGTSYYGASAEVEFPIFGLPKEIGLRGAVFADAGNLLGYSGQTNFSNFLGYVYCPGQNVLIITQPSCANVWDRNMIRTSIGASLHLGVADGSDPLRLRGPALQGQVRPDPGLQLLGRHDVLAAAGLSIRKAGAPQAGAPVVASDGTAFIGEDPLFPAEFSAFDRRSRKLVRRSFGLGGRRAPRYLRRVRARPGGTRRPDLPRQCQVSRRLTVDARRRRACRAPLRSGRARGLRRLADARALSRDGGGDGETFPKRRQAEFGLRRDRRLAGGLCTPDGAAGSRRDR